MNDTEQLCRLSNKEDVAKIDEKDWRKIIKVSGRHPYFIQSICHEYVNNGMIDLSQAMDAVNETGSIQTQFENDIRSLRPLSQCILEKIALNSSLGIQAIASKCRLRIDIIRDYLSSLIRLGLIVIKDRKIFNKAEYSIANDFFKKWLVKYKTENDETKPWRICTFILSAALLFFGLTSIFFIYKLALFTTPKGTSFFLYNCKLNVISFLLWGFLYVGFGMYFLLFLKPQWKLIVTLIASSLIALLLALGLRFF